MSSYCWLLDHGRGAQIAALFEEQGELCFMGRSLRGRSQIAEALGEMSGNPSWVVRHLWTCFRVLESNVNSLRITTIATTILAPAEKLSQKQIMVGDTDDVVRVGADGRWLFVSRRLNEAMPFETLP